VGGNGGKCEILKLAMNMNYLVLTIHFGNKFELLIEKGIIMFKRLIIYILFCVVLFTACSAPNSNMSAKNKKSNKSKTSSNKTTAKKEDVREEKTTATNGDAKEQTKSFGVKNEMLEFGEKPSTLPRRSIDTVKIVLKEIEIKKTDPIESEVSYKNLTKEFERAIADFDKENYNKAMQQFSFFKETLMPSDSLYYESMFFMSECQISMGNYSSAEEILTILLETENFENKTNEKSLLRMGQIKCATNDERKANSLFKEFKNKYPKSIYLKLANCNSLTTNK